MGGSIDEHVWRQSYKMSTSQVTFGANLIKCQLLMSTSTVILARILQSVNFSIYRYILGNTNTVVCSDIGNTNTSIHPVSYCQIWDEAVLIPSLTGFWSETVLFGDSGRRRLGVLRSTCPWPASDGRTVL